MIFFITFFFKMAIIFLLSLFVLWLLQTKHFLEKKNVLLKNIAHNYAQSFLIILVLKIPAFFYSLDCSFFEQNLFTGYNSSLNRVYIIWNCNITTPVKKLQSQPYCAQKLYGFYYDIKIFYCFYPFLFFRDIDFHIQKPYWKDNNIQYYNL